MLPIQLEVKWKGTFVKGKKRKVKTGTFMGATTDFIASQIAHYIGLMEDDGWTLKEAEMLSVKRVAGS